MAIIPGCSWIKTNSADIKGAIESSCTINASLAMHKFVIWNSLYFGQGKHGDRLTKAEHFKRIKPIGLEPAHYNQLKARKNIMPGFVKFPLTTKTNLIVDHGGESILDNSIALHPYYGFPVIPSTAIKGVTRHYCEEFIGMPREEIVMIFGQKPRGIDAQKGSIVFLDAWPVSPSNSLVSDIFTPHYKDYYEAQSSALPKDDQQPNPIPFLAVKNGTRFEFALAPSSTCTEQNIADLMDKVKKLVAAALSTFGIGAKTGSSYGYFR